MSFEDGFEVKVFVQGAYTEVNHCLAIAAEEQDAIAQHGVAQGRRSLIEDHHIHIVVVQNADQVGNQL